MNKMIATVLAVALTTGLSAAKMQAISNQDNSAQSTASMQAPYQEKGAMLTLPDGTEVSKVEVVGVLTIMRGMANHNPKAVANTVKKAYDTQMTISPGLVQRMTKIGLMNEDGTFAPHVQAIIKTFWTVDSLGNVNYIRPMQGGSEPDTSNEANQ